MYGGERWNTTERTRAAAFNWARQLRDPAFRDHLDSIGARRSRNIIPVLPSTTVAEMIGRIVHNGAAGRCILAMADETQPFGFRMAFIEVPGVEEFPYAHELDDDDRFGDIPDYEEES